MLHRPEQPIVIIPAVVVVDSVDSAVDLVDPVPTVSVTLVPLLDFELGDVFPDVGCKLLPEVGFPDVPEECFSVVPDDPCEGCVGAVEIETNSVVAADVDGGFAENY